MIQLLDHTQASYLPEGCCDIALGIFLWRSLTVLYPQRVGRDKVFSIDGYEHEFFQGVVGCSVQIWRKFS